MNVALIPLIALAITPAIAIADKMIFGKENKDWRAWMPACVMEILMFMAGMVAGHLLL
jgi:hypothetical protein